jgi:hypothetical protein
MTWSQQNPTASLGNIVVGSRILKVLPPSVEKPILQFADTKITPLPLAPLGSAHTAAESPLQLSPAPVIPTELFVSNLTVAASA